MISTNRRRYERFHLSPQYSPIGVRLLNEEGYAREGHVYDISEAGIQFELDEAIEPGTPIAMRVRLPGPSPLDDPRLDGGGDDGCYAFGHVVWTDDDDVQGPVRMAAVITRFVRSVDRERLMRRLVSGSYSRAA